MQTEQKINARERESGGGEREIVQISKIKLYASPFSRLIDRRIISKWMVICLCKILKDK